MHNNPFQTFFPPHLQLLLFIFTWNIFSLTFHFWHLWFNRIIVIVSQRHWTGKVNDNASYKYSLPVAQLTFRHESNKNEDVKWSITVICLWQGDCTLNMESKYTSSSTTSIVIRKMSIVGTTSPLCNDHHVITENLATFHPSTPIPTSLSLPLKLHSETDQLNNDSLIIYDIFLKPFKPKTHTNSI
jgi:hypothetical protein